MLILSLALCIAAYSQEECDKFDLVSLYDFPPNPNPGGEYILILLSVNEDLISSFDPHYTTMYFQSHAGDTVTVPTGRSLTLPTKTHDTIPYILKLRNARANDDFPQNFTGNLILETPTGSPFPPISICRIGYDLTTATKDIEMDDILNVFPNPFYDKFSFRSKEVIEEIHVYDVSGQAILNMEGPIEQNDIDLSDASPGLILIRIKAVSGQYYSKRLLKR